MDHFHVLLGASYLNVPICLRPAYNYYNQPWHRELVDKLHQIRTFVSPRYYYADANECIILRGETTKCLAALFYFLLHYHWADSSRIDT